MCARYSYPNLFTLHLHRISRYRYRSGPAVETRSHLVSYNCYRSQPGFARAQTRRHVRTHAEKAVHIIKCGACSGSPQLASYIVRLNNPCTCITFTTHGSIHVPDTLIFRCFISRMSVLTRFRNSVSVSSR